MENGYQPEKLTDEQRLLITEQTLHAAEQRCEEQRLAYLQAVACCQRLAEETRAIRLLTRAEK